MKVNSTYITTDLIIDNTKYGADETVLLLSAESIDLIEAIADVAESVHVFDVHYQNLQRLEKVLRHDNVVVHYEVFPTARNSYDTAIVIVPKGRELGRAQLWSAMQCLKPNGDCYLAGPNKGGAKSLIKDADELFGNANVIAYKKSHRIALSRKDSQQDYLWGKLPTEIQSRTFTTALGVVEVATMPGVFSWDALDEGTAFLLENLDVRDSKRVLDMGCGNGVIGASIAPQVEHLTLVDDNLLAVQCATETTESFDNAIAKASNVYSALADEQFDLIVCNPPFHQKFDINSNIADRIIRDAPQYLTKGGRLVLVANAFLKYESAMQEYFSHVSVKARNTKYKVLEGVL